MLQIWSKRWAKGVQGAVRGISTVAGTMVAGTTAGQAPGSQVQAPKKPSDGCPAMAQSHSSLSCHKALPLSPLRRLRETPLCQPGQTQKEMGKGCTGCTTSVCPGMRNAAGTRDAGHLRCFLQCNIVPNTRLNLKLYFSASSECLSNPLPALTLQRVFWLKGQAVVSSDTNSGLAYLTSHCNLYQHKKTSGLLCSWGQKGNTVLHNLKIHPDLHDAD